MYLEVDLVTAKQGSTKASLLAIGITHDATPIDARCHFRNRQESDHPYADG